MEIFYSNLYNDALKTRRGVQSFPISDIENYQKRINKKWQEVENKYITKIAEITGIPWKKLPIIYLNTKGHNFSDPVTIQIKNDINVAIQNIVHELIHVNLCQEYDETLVQKLHNDYKRYSFVVRVHILVHAIHFEVLKATYASKKIINDVIHYPDGVNDKYTLAWKIAKKIGYKEIIRTYTNSSI